MRIFLAKALRQLVKVSNFIVNYYRILSIKILFPNIEIDFKTSIESGCKIVCVDGGSIKISNCSIGYGSQIFCDSTGNIKISNSFIGRNCSIVAKKSIIIKPGCAIAEMVVIRDQNHNVNADDILNTAFNFTTDNIVINSNVWIGAKATILLGVEIGESAIIAAHAVVNKCVLKREIWGGVPAKFIKVK